MLNIYQTKSCYVPGEGIQPYLQPLMEHLLGVLKMPTTSVKQKQLAISAIGATSNAAKTLMQPYFQEIIEQFKGYLAAGDDENLRKLQIQVLGKYSEICLNRTSLGPACLCLE